MKTKPRYEVLLFTYVSSCTKDRPGSLSSYNYRVKEKVGWTTSASGPIKF